MNQGMKHNLAQLLGTVSRSMAYLCPLWASMNWSAIVMSSHTSVCKYRSVLEATNIPTISLPVHIVVCKDTRNMISLCFIHTDTLVIYTDTLVNISAIETEKILF